MEEYEKQAKAFFDERDRRRQLARESVRNQFSKIFRSKWFKWALAILIISAIISSLF